jgi:hypothetical protein
MSRQVRFTAIFRMQRCSHYVRRRRWNAAELRSARTGVAPVPTRARKGIVFNYADCFFERDAPSGAEQE